MLDKSQAATTLAAQRKTETKTCPECCESRIAVIRASDMCRKCKSKLLMRARKLEKEMIEDLRVLYPNVKFSLVSELVNRPCEDAFYPRGGEPKASRETGSFLRMENAHGGADTLRLSSDKIHSLAEWHNKR